MSNKHITDEQILDLAVQHNLGRVLPPLGPHDTGNVFYTDNSYRTAALFDFARAILALRPAAQPVGEPIKPFFAVSIASRKWSELQEQGHRMQHVAFDGGPGGAGVIDPWGKVTWGKPSPERVPMTDEQRSLIIERAVDKTVDRSAAALYAICETERIYGITTPKTDK